VPTPEEAAQQEQRRAEQEQRRAEQAELQLEERQEKQRLQVSRTTTEQLCRSELTQRL